jgi:hypothetical protein
MKMFRPKVLDRANVIEFNDVDLKHYAGGAASFRTSHMILGNENVRDVLYPQTAARESRFQTFDTHENRFIKFFLQELLWKIEAISTALNPDTFSYFNPDIGDCLKSLENSIHHFLSHNMWQDVGTMQFVPVNSQVLQKKEGYRQLFSLYSLLQLATRCDFLQTDFKNLLEIKDVPTLYEYWCFFQIKSIIDTFSTPTAIDRLISEDPVEHKLTTGLCITYQDGISFFSTKHMPVPRVWMIRMHQPCPHTRPAPVIPRRSSRILLWKKRAKN